ncbi:hypothetical protein I4U23_024977 [Adineta vaga]|nr:hypothetical protein I4U23_024977 [Adineta vaga]
MNESNTNNSSMCNQKQMLKNLPLKKRRTYIIDSLITNDEQNENSVETNNQSYSQHESIQQHVPLSPPSSPHIEFLRQQYAYLLANSTNIQSQQYLHPLTYDYSVNQSSGDNINRLIAQQQTCAHEEATIDEHFRKSLGNNYGKFSDRCFTPDDSSSNSSSIEQTSVDSIEEHFARSLAKFRPLNHQKTESAVDDHFAKALGSTTWNKLKEKL